MKRPIFDWKMIFNWRTYTKLQYVRRSLLLWYILFLEYSHYALPLSLVHRLHHHHCISRPYVDLPQRDCELAHTSSGVDARVSVSPLSRLVNIC